jgi:A/G-specific adenine glycosylase
MKKKPTPLFVRNVIPWYLKEGRDLPWRTTQDPYAIWISEIILQQTRVQQGLGYYFRFLEALPNVAALAEAPEDQVFRLWQGLGYYSRAKNLHKAAKIICSELNGLFPKTFEGLKSLPGIGDYTAAAIASFAFDVPKASIDGNVLRWTSRFLGSAAPIDDPKTKKSIQLLLDEWIEDASAHSFNQASMELGAIICTPKDPKCNQCPLSSDCVAFQNALTNELPIKSKKTKVKQQLVTALFIQNNHGNWAILKRQPNEIWGGLYTLPLHFSDETSPDSAMKELLKQFDLKFDDIVIKDSWSTTHLLTHRKLQVHIFSILLEDMPKNPYKFEKWIGVEDMKDLGFPKVFSDFYKHKGLL